MVKAQLVGLLSEDIVHSAHDTTGVIKMSFSPGSDIHLSVNYNLRTL